MIIEAPKKKVFEKPKPGTYLAVLVDIVYLDNVSTTYNGITSVKNQLKFVWALAKKDSEGKNFQVRSKPVNRTYGENSNLTKLTTEIQNGTPPAIVSGGFDPESLIGSVNIIGVVHKPGVDRKTGQPTVYVNVSSVNPANEGDTLAIPSDYIRVKDRPAKTPFQQTGASAQAAPATAASSDDDSEDVEV